MEITSLIVGIGIGSDLLTLFYIYFSRQKMYQSKSMMLCLKNSIQQVYK